MFVIRFNEEQILKNSKDNIYCTVKTIEEAFELAEKIKCEINHSEVENVNKYNNILLVKYTIILLDKEKTDKLIKKGILNNQIPMVI